MNTQQLLTAGMMLFSSAMLSFAPNDKYLVNDQVLVNDNMVSDHKPTDKSRARIQVALLLDTSSSMDGLIDQAKSRLWNIINTLTTLKYDGQEPIIEISLYEYGNSGLSSKEGWIRQVVPLTNNLDLISQKLFALTTYGGDEYCGWVIDRAIKDLKWSNQKNDMKLVYIAGNEPFNQGGISYKESIASAKNRGIYVNTIHCGNIEEGIRTFWQDGAVLGSGKFFNIDSDKKIRYIATPYDDKIAECNQRLNATYVSYGASGESMRMNQQTQDMNAASMSKGNSVERALTKSKKSAYDNSSWDLVDNVRNDDKALEKISKKDLPKELQDKSTEELKTYVAKVEKERSAIQEEMTELGKQRQKYIDEQMKNTEDEDDLGNAMSNSIMELAMKNGYKN